MNKQGPIVIIEDDAGDRHLLSMVFDELAFGNQILFLRDGSEALAYFEKSDVCPFLVLSDINMPRLDGFQLRTLIQDDSALRKRCIPFLFFTTAANEQTVYDAYALSAQGFFVKPPGYEQLREMMRKIVEYWRECHTPFDYSAPTLPAA